METKKVRTKPYDCWLLWFLSNRCNLDCAYCTVGPIKKSAKITKINIPNLINTLEISRKIFKITFTGGGEPFLVPNLVEACIEITKKHYVSFDTNLTSEKIIEFANKIDPNRVISITASLHIMELEKKGLLQAYIDNFLLLKREGFNVVAKEVAHPLLFDDIQRYRKFFEDKKITLNFDPFLGKHKGKFYPDSYTEKEIKAFGFGKNLKTAYHRKGKLCNAGYNVGVIDKKGNAYPCNPIKKSIGNIYKKIKFKNNLIVCPFRFCGCPFDSYDPYLYSQAIKEADKPPRKINSLFRLYIFFKTKVKYLFSRFYISIS